MELIEKEDQIRRDCWITIECENCGYRETDVKAYDDRNFWDNVLPNLKCGECGKSTNDIDPEIRQQIYTKYPSHLQV